LSIILQILLYPYFFTKNLIIKVLVEVPLYWLRLNRLAGVCLKDLSMVVRVIVSYPVPLEMLHLILVEF